MKKKCISCGEFKNVKPIGTCTGIGYVCKQCYKQIAKDFNFKLRKKMLRGII